MLLVKLPVKMKKVCLNPNWALSLLHAGWKEGRTMELTLKMVLIVAIGIFTGSFIDAIAGGGGLITWPAYLLAGLPAHTASATNKLSSSIGLIFSGARYIKGGYVNWRLAIPSAVVAICGAFCGAKLQLLIPEKYLQYILVIALPVVAFLVLRKKRIVIADRVPRHQLLIVMVSSLLVGAYDGFYGPGSGTFLILLYTQWAKLDLRTANGNVKIINFSSNISSLVTFFLAGKVFVALGLIGAVFAALGQFIGSGFAIKDGEKIVRPVILLVLVLLVIKVVSGLF